MLDEITRQHPVPTLLYSADWRIVDANDAYTELTGLTRDELRGVMGHELLHPDDLAQIQTGVDVQLADPGRAWPYTYLRLPSVHGGWTHVSSYMTAIDGGYVIAFVQSSLHFAMDRLVDVLATGRGIAAVLHCVIAATESTGHYAASLHYREGFSSGAFDQIVVGSLGNGVDLESPLIEAHVADACLAGKPTYIRLSALGIDEPLESGRLRVRQCVAYPIIVKGDPAGALCVWTEQQAQLGIYGAAHVERVARLAGEAVSHQLDADAARPVRVVGGLKIDLVQRVAEVDGRVVKLTPIEATILDLLSQVPGRVVSRERIMMQLFGSTHTGGTRTCDAHVKNLRAKLNDDPAIPRFIATVRGEGYALILSRNARRFGLDRQFSHR
jgi:PAS domain S-box-containing protein